MCERTRKKKPQEMFGLLQVCLFSVFAEGCRADTREREGSSRSSITSLLLFIPKQDEKLVEVTKYGLSGYLTACVIW